MDALDGIDTSAIEELLQVKEEEELLAERLRKMGEMRGSVSPIVYARVEQDYRGRATALDERARPLKARARIGYRQLLAIHHELEEALAAVRLEAEEREFRHRIGEFDEAAFAEQAREGEERLAERERDLAASESLRQRFLAAFRDRDELERTEEPEPAEIAAATDAGVAPRSALPPEPAVREDSPELPEEGVTRPMSPEPQRPPLPDETVPPLPPLPPPPAIPGDEAEEDGTVILPWRVAPPAASPAPELGATMVLPSARLVGQDEGLEEEFHLGPATFVGRTSECQVRIARPAISRRHARLDLAADGSHVVTDLGSENGTWVNGVRVTEQRLADGDLVAFGTVRFLYKAT